MSKATANNTNKDTNPAPWKDWNINEVFLKEVNDYCEKHDKKFVDIVDGLIKKIAKGVYKIEDVLVRSPCFVFDLRLLMRYIDSLMLRSRSSLSLLE